MRPGGGAPQRQLRAATQAQVVVLPGAEDADVGGVRGADVVAC
jgi:hypothetical protein